MLRALLCKNVIVNSELCCSKLGLLLRGGSEEQHELGL
jgi:hypothetical protein